MNLRKFLAGLLLLVALPAVRAQVLFTINATVTGTSANPSLGYAVAQNHTFVFTLNPGPMTGGAISGDRFAWDDETTADAPMWASITGTGLGGTWTRPSGFIEPYSSIRVYDPNSLELQAGTDNGSTGLTANGVPVENLSLLANFLPSLFPIATNTLPDPATYFSGYFATYSSFDSASFQLLGGGEFVDFSVNSITISAATPIPEPAGIAVGAGALALLIGGVVRRHRPPAATTTC